MYVALLGATGRLGSLIAELLAEQKISYFNVTREVLSKSDLFIQFIKDLPKDVVFLDVSLPAGTARLCYQMKELESFHTQKIKGLVIGTTGHTPLEKELIAEAAQKLPVCLVSNFSKGIFLFEEILRAKTLSGLSISDLARQLGFDLALTEAHHTQKKDAPSGTALTLAEACALPSEKITSVRVGKIIGEHSLYASGPSESLKITHTAHTRRLFAEGAVDLCKNIYKKSPSVGFLRKEDFFI